MGEAKNYYEILGVRDGATREEIEKRYDILLKAYRAKRASGDIGEDEEKEWNAITEAYRELTEYKSKSAMKPEPISPLHQKVNNLIRKMGFDDKKVNNFFHYYTKHIVIGIIALIIVAISVRSCVTAVKPDINIAFVGEFYIEDTTALAEKIKSSVPEIKEPAIHVMTLTQDLDNINPEMDYTMRMKFMAMIGTQELDVLIFDRAQFELYGKQGAMEVLDAYAEEKDIAEELTKDCWLEDEETGEKHLYGMDISDSEFFEDIFIVGKEKIVAIAVNTKNYEKAMKVMEILIK